jgi:hypothetical protein
MNLIPSERKYWDVGEEPPFRLGKDACQKFLLALVQCDGKIHDQHSLDVGHSGRLMYGMKPHEIAVLFRISLPVGMHVRFDEIMGKNVLTEIPVINLNFRENVS